MESGSVLWRLLRAFVGGAGSFLIIAVVIMGFWFVKEYFFGSKDEDDEKQ